MKDYEIGVVLAAIIIAAFIGYSIGYGAGYKEMDQSCEKNLAYSHDLFSQCQETLRTRLNCISPNISVMYMNSITHKSIDLSNGTYFKAFYTTHK